MAKESELARSDAWGSAMSTPIDEAAWARVSEAALADIARWRREHPVATFDEIEDAITGRLRPLDEQLFTGVIHTSAQANLVEGAARPGCPSGGERLQAKGRKRRTIVTQRGELIPLDRTEGHCPRCHAGLFPPGS